LVGENPHRNHPRRRVNYPYGVLVVWTFEGREAPNDKP
jgi:hypothetical protein